jgi:mono/diheme cytochrome c family protein
MVRYRGVIQHRNFVTSFLRAQIEARGLVQPTGLGRIWRITAKGTAAPAPCPDLAAADPAGLLAALASDHGSRRDLALRELVQRGLVAAAPAVRERLSSDARPAVRIVALSALAGLGALTATDLRAALRDQDAGVLAFALQHAAGWLARGDRLLWLAVEQLAAAAPPAVVWQLALTLGELPPEPATGRLPVRALAVLAGLLRRSPDDANLRAAVAAAAGPAGIIELLAGSTMPALADTVLRDLATRAARGKQPPVLAALLAFADRQPTAALPVLQGLRAALPRGTLPGGALVLPDTGPLLRLSRAEPEPLRSLAGEMLAAAALDGPAATAEVVALSADEQQRVHAGERVYARACAACHQLDGNGMQGLAPPLRDSEWVLGPSERLVRIALHGVRGPIEVAGTAWNLEMPGQRHLGDDDLAQVLSYVRRAFGHRASPIAAPEVAGLRRADRQRSEPWTAAELTTK